MKDMTSQQIRERIAAVEAEQATHQARDFDGELKAVMLAGGDVDALENQQLEAERTARRLRVELAALESALPEVQQREALAQLEVLKKTMADQPKEIKTLADKIAPLVDELAPLIIQITDAYNRRTLAHKGALTFVRANALPPDSLAGAGQIVCTQWDQAKQQLKTAMGYTGVDMGQPLDVMRFSTGTEFSKYQVQV